MEELADALVQEYVVACGGPGCWALDSWTADGRDLAVAATLASEEGWAVRGGVVMCPRCTERDGGE